MLAYLAPEVAAGQDADFRSDVFSFGATLYAALEGEPPFGFEDNLIALLRRVAGGEIRPPQGSGPLTGLLLLLLRRDPAVRPTMREACAALTAAASGQPLPAFRPRTPTLVLPARRVSRRAVLAGGLAAGLVVVGVVIGTLISDGTGGGQAVGGQGSTPPATNAPACEARFRFNGSWPDGYQAEVTVHNDGTKALTGWSVTWSLPRGQTIDQVWNGILTVDGSSVTVNNAEYNAIVRAGESLTFGLTAKAPEGSRPEPQLSCRSD